MSGRTTIKGALGESCEALQMASSKGVWSNYMILSKDSGVFEGLHFEPTFEKII